MLPALLLPGPRGRSSHPRSHVKGPRLWPVQRLAQLRALLGQRDDDLAAVAVSGSPRDAMVAGQRGAGGAVAEPPQPRRPAQSGSAFGCLWACRAAAAWRAVAGQRTDTPFALLRNQRLLRVNIGRAAGGSREQRADAWDDAMRGALACPPAGGLLSGSVLLDHGDRVRALGENFQIMAPRIAVDVP
jgi:hypothetical protein